MDPTGFPFFRFLVTEQMSEPLIIVISDLLYMNIFWGLVNLLPVFPLDGGQVARELFEQVDPWNGFVRSLWLSIITGVAVAIASWVYLDSRFMPLMFVSLADLQLYDLQQISGGGPEAAHGKSRRNKALLPPGAWCCWGPVTSLGLSTVVETARHAWGQPLEVLAAIGHGRSYGSPAACWDARCRGLSQCGLWKNWKPAPLFPRRPWSPISATTSSTASDVPIISQWVETCLERLSTAGRSSGGDSAAD